MTYPTANPTLLERFRRHLEGKGYPGPRTATTVSLVRAAQAQLSSLVQAQPAAHETALLYAYERELAEGTRPAFRQAWRAWEAFCRAEGVAVAGLVPRIRGMNSAPFTQGYLDHLVVSPVPAVHKVPAFVEHLVQRLGLSETDAAQTAILVSEGIRTILASTSDPKAVLSRWISDPKLARKRKKAWGLYLEFAVQHRVPVIRPQGIAP